MTDTKEVLIQQLCKITDIDRLQIQHYHLYSNEKELIEDMKDILEDEELIRLTIFRVQYRKFAIEPF